MNAGIRHLTIHPVTPADLTAPDNTLRTIHQLNLKKNSKFSIMPHDEITDFLERPLPNRFNFRIEADSYQTNVASLILAHQLAQNNGVMAEVVPNSFTGGVYRFGHLNHLGYDFEFTLTDKERMLKHIMEASFEDTTAKTLMSAAISNTRQWITNDTFDIVTYNTPNVIGNTLLTHEWIKSFSFSMKTVGQKNTSNRTIVDYIQVNLEITTFDVRASEILRLANFHLGTPITITLGETSTNASGSIVISANSLFPKINYDNETNSRNLKLIYTGKLPLSNFVFTEGANQLLITA